MAGKAEIQVKVKGGWKLVVYQLLKRFTSRKFLAALAAEAASIAALWGWDGDQLAGTIVRGGAVVGMIAVPIFYLLVEGQIDKAAVQPIEKEGDDA